MKFIGIIFLSLTLLSTTNSFAQKKKERKKDKKESTEYKNTLTEDQHLKKNSLYFSALKEKQLGNYDIASEYFRQTLLVDPTDADINYELAQCLFRSGKVNDASVYAKEATRLGENNVWYWQLLADIYEKQNKAKDLVSTYHKMIGLFPERIDIFYDYATSLLIDEEYGDAIKVYDKIQEKTGLTEDLAVQKERIYLRMGKLEKAAAELEELIKLNPSEPKYLILLGDFYSATKQIEKAFDIYNKALALDPSNGFIRLALADYYKGKGNANEALNQLKKAFQNPDLDIDDKIRILASYFPVIKEEKYQKSAFELANLVVEAHPNEAKAHAILADFYYQIKKSKEAREEYYKAAALKKDIFAVWQNILFIDAELNEKDSLIKDSEEALALFPEQVLVYYFNGIAKAQKGQHKEAIEVLEKGVRLGSDNEALIAQMYAGMGDSFNELKEYKKSDQAYDKSLEIVPKQQFVLNNYAYYLSLRGESLDKAERMSKLSNELEQNNSSFEDTYAWILYKLNRFDEAKKWIEKALQDGGLKSPTVNEHYGDILFRLGQSELAVDNWKKAKEFGGKSEFLDRKIADKKLYE